MLDFQYKEYTGTMKNLLREVRYLIIFAVVSILLYLSLIFMPVFTIPGNDLLYQLSIFHIRDFVIMGLFSLLTGLNIALQIYARKKGNSNTRSALGVAGNGASGIFGGIVATAACTSCLAALFAVIGLGSGAVFFVLEHQLYFLVAAIGFMLLSLHFTIRKINKHYETC